MSIPFDNDLLGSVLPNVFFKSILLESGGNPIVLKDPHINLFSASEEMAYLGGPAQFATIADEFKDHPQGADAIANAVEEWKQMMNSKNSMKSWQPSESDSEQALTVTLKLSIKDVYDPKIGNVQFLLDSFFLEHVYLVVLQFAAGTMSQYKNEYSEQLSYIQSTAEGIGAKAGSDYFLGGAPAWWPTIAARMSLKEVLQQSSPLFGTDVFADGNPQKLLSFLLKNYQHTTTNNDGSITIDIPFSLTMNPLPGIDPVGLSYLVFTELDIQSIKEDIINIDSINDQDLPNYGTNTLVGKYNFKEVISLGKVNKKDTIFLLPNGNQWAGEVQKITLSHEGLTKVTNAYETKYTQAPIKLTKVKIKENVISDFRVLRDLKKSFFDFQLYQNHLFGASETIKFGGPNSYIMNSHVLDSEGAIFGDLLISSRHSIEGQPEANSLFITIDFDKMMKKYSIFPKLWKTTTGIASLRANTIIKDFKILRRPVKLNPHAIGLGEDKWIPAEQDPNPHVAGTSNLQFGGDPYGTILRSIESPPTTFSLDVGPGQVTAAADLSFKTIAGSGQVIKGYDVPENIFGLAGYDSNIPSYGGQRYQYGVKFTIQQDGAIHTFEGLLSELKVRLKSVEGLKFLIEAGNVYATQGGTGPKKINVLNGSTELYNSDFLLYSPPWLDGTVADLTVDMVGVLAKYIEIYGIFASTPTWAFDGATGKWNVTYQSSSQLVAQQQALGDSLALISNNSPFAFLNFYGACEEMIHILENTLKVSKKKILGKSTSVGDMMDDFETMNPTNNSHEKGKKETKIEHWFPNVFRSPSNNSSGYGYIITDDYYQPGVLDTFLDQDFSGRFPVVPGGFFDDIAKMETLKYYATFMNAPGAVPQNFDPWPEGSPLKGVFNSWGNEQVQYFSPQYAVVDGKYHNLNVYNYDWWDGGGHANLEPNFAAVNYQDVFHDILTRKNNYFDQHPVDVLNQTATEKAFLKDMRLMSKILSARYCTMRALGNAAEFADEYGDPSSDLLNDSMFDPNIAIYDVEKNEGAKYETLEAYMEDADIGNTPAKDWEEYRNISQNILKTLILAGNTSFLTSFNLADYKFWDPNTSNGTTGGPNNIYTKFFKDGTVQFDPRFQSFMNSLPNQYKGIFLAAETHQSMTGEDIQTLGGTNLQDALWSQFTLRAHSTYKGILNPESAVDMYGSYFNFYNLARVEKFVGFAQNQVKNPIWQKLTYQDMWSTLVTGANVAYLCRFVRYQDSTILKMKRSKLEMPIYNKYFILYSS